MMRIWLMWLFCTCRSIGFFSLFDLFRSCWNINSAGRLSLFFLLDVERIKATHSSPIFLIAYLARHTHVSRSRFNIYTHELGNTCNTNLLLLVSLLWIRQTDAELVLLLFSDYRNKGYSIIIINVKKLGNAEEIQFYSISVYLVRWCFMVPNELL